MQSLTQTMLGQNAQQQQKTILWLMIWFSYFPILFRGHNIIPKCMPTLNFYYVFHSGRHTHCTFSTLILIRHLHGIFVKYSWIFVSKMLANEKNMKMKFMWPMNLVVAKNGRMNVIHHDDITKIIFGPSSWIFNIRISSALFMLSFYLSLEQIGHM